MNLTVQFRCQCLQFGHSLDSTAKSPDTDSKMILIRICHKVPPLGKI